MPELVVSGFGSRFTLGLVKRGDRAVEAVEADTPVETAERERECAVDGGVHNPKTHLSQIYHASFSSGNTPVFARGKAIDGLKRRNTETLHVTQTKHDET